MMPFRQIAFGAALGSALLLAGALAFQYLGGLAPCPLCLWQRWPHGLAVATGALAVAMPHRAWALLGVSLMLTGAGIGFYHAGIELGWWPGPATCAAPDIADLTPEQLLDDILAAPVVHCDEVAWSLLGISMAGWNAILSLGLAGLWARAYRLAYASSSASQ